MPKLSQHACFSCRKVFKKPHAYPLLPLGDMPFAQRIHPCPECGRKMPYMGYKFRAPALSAVKEWRHIEESIKLGRNWTILTLRKEKLGPKISPALKKALGVALIRKHP